MNTEEKSGYFKELALNLQKEGFTVKLEEDGLLPVELEGRQLCRIVKNGGVRYREKDIAGKALALERVVDIAQTTAEYMCQIEAAPFLTASGLEGNYRLLAEFNGAVLAGHPTRYGVQFVTWERDFDHTGVCHGHYMGGDYVKAKQDFAVRSGLVPHSALFAPEQLAEIYRSIHETLDSGCPITAEREKLLEDVAEQIKRTVPDLEERVNQSNRKELELGSADEPEHGGMQFQ